MANAQQSGSRTGGAAQRSTLEMGIGQSSMASQVLKRRLLKREYNPRVSDPGSESSGAARQPARQQPGSQAARQPGSQGNAYIIISIIDIIIIYCYCSSYYYHQISLAGSWAAGRQVGWTSLE